MASPQRMAGGWFGPGNRELTRPYGKVDRLPRRPRLRLPTAVGRELAQIAGAARAAADGPSVAAAGLADDAAAILLHRATLGPTTLDYDRIASLGYDRWLEEQLDFEALDDRELEDALHATLHTLDLSAQGLYQQYEKNPIIPVLELWTATIYRALFSPRQLFERMAIFWSDHFSIDIFGDFQNFLKPVDDREVVRANALGSFPEMLRASAHSPAMLLYLTNDSNVKGHPNENYARELLELHTMGADNGYSEKDVKEVARCFTGWSWKDPYRGAVDAGLFRFYDYLHDNRTKRVLGKTIKAKGVADGERVLDMLVERKETAEFVARKMLRYLWGYSPPQQAIKKVAKAYSRSDGDIRPMVRTALRESQLKSATPKLKRPFHLAISALRALGADVRDTNRLLGTLSVAGHLPFDWAAPNGYPDTAEWWSGYLLPRWDFGATILRGSDVAIDPAVDDPTGGTRQIIDRLDRLLLNRKMRPGTRAALVKFLSGKKSRARVRDAIGLVIASPEFQEY